MMLFLFSGKIPVTVGTSLIPWVAKFYIIFVIIKKY